MKITFPVVHQIFKPKRGKALDTFSIVAIGCVVLFVFPVFEDLTFFSFHFGCIHIVRMQNFQKF